MTTDPAIPLRLFGSLDALRPQVVISDQPDRDTAQATGRWLRSDLVVDLEGSA